MSDEFEFDPVEVLEELKRYNPVLWELMHARVMNRHLSKEVENLRGHSKELERRLVKPENVARIAAEHESATLSNEEDVS